MIREKKKSLKYSFNFLVFPSHLPSSTAASHLPEDKSEKLLEQMISFKNKMFICTVETSACFGGFHYIYFFHQEKLSN